MMLKKKLELGLVIREKGSRRSPRYPGHPRIRRSVRGQASTAAILGGGNVLVCDVETLPPAERMHAAIRRSRPRDGGHWVEGVPTHLFWKKYSSNRRVLVNKVGDAPSCRGLCLKLTQ